MNEAEEARGFDALLEYLKRTRGFDLSAYKRASPATGLISAPSSWGCNLSKARAPCCRFAWTIESNALSFIEEIKAAWHF